jgi:hypothetical protein
VSVATVLWCFNVVLLVLLAWLAWFVILGRKDKINERRVRNLDEARRYLEAIPGAAALIDAWCAMPPDSVRRGGPWNIFQLVSLLVAAPPEPVARIGEIAEEVIRQANSATSLMDDGLVRPKDLARDYGLITPELITALALAEPWVWFEVLVHGRGRWGYRPLNLRHVLDRLRVHAPDPDMRKSITLRLHGRDLHVQRAMSLPTVLALHLKHTISSPTVSVRTKVRQKKVAAAVRSELATGGLIPEVLQQSRQPEAW